jgi:hypothetical protein
VIHAHGGLIHHIDAFLDPRLFPLFGVPVHPALRHITH